MKMTVFILLLCQCLVCVPLAHAGDAEVLWAQAVDMAKRGEPDFAFMDFRMLFDTCPDFFRRSAVEFSLGEYYFSQHMFSLAIPQFEDLYAKDPKGREALVALVYLYKMAEAGGRLEAAKDYQKKIITSHPVVFIFKNSQSVEYFSGFQHKYKVVFYINRIEVLIDGNLFVEIPGQV
jgi:tetratricopeptide (TPR) repeat protein